MVHLQITDLERKMIFQTSMIMVHVNLPGCSLPATAPTLQRCGDVLGAPRHQSPNVLQAPRVEDLLLILVGSAFRGGWMGMSIKGRRWVLLGWVKVMGSVVGNFTLIIKTLHWGYKLIY